MSNQNSPSKRVRYRKSMEKTAGARRALEQELTASEKDKLGKDKDKEGKGSAARVDAAVDAQQRQLALTLFQATVQKAPSFSGDEKDIVEYSFAALAMYEFISAFCEIVNQFPNCTPMARALLQFAFPKETSFGEWFVAHLRTKESREELTVMVEAFSLKFLENRSNEARRAWGSISLRRDESPSQLAKRMRQLEAMFDGDAAEADSTRRFKEALPDGLAVLVRVKGDFDEVVGEAQEIWTRWRLKGETKTAARSTSAVGSVSAAETASDRAGERAAKVAEGSAVAPERKVFKCHSCGQSGHFSRNCPAATCQKCGEKGHMLVDCPGVETNKKGNLSSASW